MKDNERYSRQSFLGLGADERIGRCVVGVVGLGGGGSHIVQQLAHIGFKRYVLYDGDTVEESNLNRLVGGRTADVIAKTPKLHIATMMVLGLQPDADIEGFAGRWQDNPEPLRSCNLIFGCVDTYAGRDELERCARRYLVNYIDIGMDVRQIGDSAPVIGGQVILSMPGSLCMHCMGFLTEEKLAIEGTRYGDSGGRPQVVWPNGVLASTAVGIGVDLITDWSSYTRGYIYLGYDGNRGTVTPHWRTRNLKDVTACSHYPPEQVGNPIMNYL